MLLEAQLLKGRVGSSQALLLCGAHTVPRQPSGHTEETDGEAPHKGNLGPRALTLTVTSSTSAPGGLGQVMHSPITCSSLGLEGY